MGSDTEIDDGTGGLFDEPEGYYPPTPPPTTQTHTMLNGKTIQLHLVGHSSLEAHHLWNGSRIISDYFESNLSEIKDKTVLELGAGAGLPSIVAAVLGASRVVVTDYPDPDLVVNMWKNIDECDLLPWTESDGERKQDVIVADGYVWGADPKPLVAHLSEPEQGFDVLILADLLFRHSEHGNMLSSVAATLRRNNQSKAFVFFTSYRPWLQHKDLAFFDLARERGFEIEKILEKKMDKAMFENDPGDEDVRKTCTGFVLQWPAGKWDT